MYHIPKGIMRSCTQPEHSAAAKRIIEAALDKGYGPVSCIDIARAYLEFTPTLRPAA